MEAFLTIILIFILIVWLLGRLLPHLFVWYVKRKSGGTGMRDRKGGKWRGGGNEGDVEIEYSEPQEKIIAENMGEYIDFEEEKNGKS